MSIYQNREAIVTSLIATPPHPTPHTPSSPRIRIPTNTNHDIPLMIPLPLNHFATSERRLPRLDGAILPQGLGIAAAELGRRPAWIKSVDYDTPGFWRAEVHGMTRCEHAQRRLRAPVPGERLVVELEGRVEAGCYRAHAARYVD